MEKLPKLERFAICNYYIKQHENYRLLLIRRIESHQSQKYKIIKEQA